MLQPSPPVSPVDVPRKDGEYETNDDAQGYNKVRSMRSVCEVMLDRGLEANEIAVQISLPNAPQRTAG